MRDGSLVSSSIEYLRDPLRKNSLFIIGTHLVIALVGFLFWVVAARLYTDEEVGLATGLISAMFVLRTLSKLGLDIGLIRFLPEEQDKRDMINTCLTLGGICSAVLAVVFLAGVKLWTPDLGFVQDNVRYAVFFVVFSVLSSLVVLQSYVFIPLRCTEFTFIQNIIAGLRLPLLWPLMAIGAFGVFSSWGIAVGVAFLAGVFFTARRQRGYRPMPVVRRRVVGKMLRFSLGNYAAETLRELPPFVLNLMIINMLGAEMGAYFFVAWTISDVLFMISYGTSYSLLAEASHRPDGLRSDVVRAARFMFQLLLPAIFVLLVFGGMILGLFGGEYASNGATLLRIYAVSGIPIVFNSIYVTVKRVQRQTKPIMLIYGFVAVLSVGVAYPLLQRYDLVGAGIAWVCSQLVVTAVTGPSLLRMWSRSAARPPESST